MDTRQVLLTDENMIDLISTHYDMAKEHIIKYPDEELIPTLTVVTDDELDGKRTIMVYMFTDFNENRYDLLTATGLRIGGEGHLAVLAILTTEAWMSQYRDEDARRAAEDGPPVQPRDDPNRMEIACTVGVTVDNRSRFLYGEIHREDGIASVEDIEPVVEGVEAMWQSNLVSAFWRGYAIGFLTRSVEGEAS